MNTKKKLIMLLMSVMTGAGLFAQNLSELPEKARQYLGDKFPDAEISRVEKEKSWFSWDENEMYEVHFSNGWRIDFNKAGNPTEITSGESRTELPEDILPESLYEYLESHYPQEKLVSWEMDDKKQEVELADGREVEFDLDGNFLKED